MSFFSNLFSPAVTLELELKGERKMMSVPTEAGSTEQLPLFAGTDRVKGVLHLKVAPGKRVEHNGIKVELVGQIEMFYDRNNPYEFVSVVQDVEPAGELNSSRSLPFEFGSVEKQYESYVGMNVRLRYFVRASLVRFYNTTLTSERDFFVMNLHPVTDVGSSVKMEVGIEDSLHIEFEYCKTKFHLRDVVVGKIYFLLVRIKIKNMEVAIIRRESTGAGANLYNENETIAKFEVMDGAPVKGESIPIRMFLNAYDLTPTYRNVNNKFSVRYFINLVLIDEEDRRYFKQQEITMYRTVVD